MAAVSGERILQEAIEIIGRYPTGIKYSQLTAAVAAALPDANKSYIQGCIWNLQVTHPDRVEKPSRGLFVPVPSGIAPTTLTDAQEAVAPVPPEPAKNDGKPRGEERLYEPFANWLKEDEEVVNHVGVLGGNFGKGTKWQAPDVVGVNRPSASDIVKFPIEIVTAEIKDDGGDEVTAFGQAMSYRLFSHKVYVVVSKSTRELERLEALCIVHGIGLATFDSSLKFERVTVPQPGTPDVYYMNEFVGKVKDKDKGKDKVGSLFSDLFG